MLRQGWVGLRRISPICQVSPHHGYVRGTTTGLPVRDAEHFDATAGQSLGVGPGAAARFEYARACPKAEGSAAGPAMTGTTRRGHRRPRIYAPALLL